MTVGVAIHWHFRVLASSDDLFRIGDLLTEALLAAEESTPGVLDSAVSVNKATATIEIELTASGSTWDEAVATGQGAITEALRSVGATPAELKTTEMALA